MIETNNPLQPCLKTLFSQLNYLNGMNFLLNNQLDLFVKMLKENLKDAGRDISDLFTGSALVIRDLTEWPASGWARYYPSGSFKSKGEEIFQVSDRLIQNGSLWAISQAYEAFEVFVKDLTASFLFNNQELAENEKLKKHAKSIKESFLEMNTFEYWQRLVRLAFRNNDYLLSFLRTLSPEIDEAENRNNRVIKIPEWYAVISEVRHAITHSDGVIKKTRLNNWSNDRIELLRNTIPGTEIDLGYKMLPTYKEANEILKFFLEYGFALFKALSNTKGYTWEIFNKKA